MKNSKKRSKSAKKSEGEICLPHLNSVSLNTNTEKLGDTFLGYKTKNINQLWDWKTLEDVEFK